MLTLRHIRHFTESAQNGFAGAKKEMKFDWIEDFCAEYRNVKRSNA